MIVDDHPVVREGMAAMLSTERDFRVVGACANGEEALASIRRAAPDLALMDVRMPRLGGFETLVKMRQVAPQVRVMLLAGLPARSELERAREMGAAGYLPKSVSQDRLVAALRQAAADPSSFASDERATPVYGGILTERETEILGYFAKGKTREEVGIILGLSPETVKNHIKRITQKLEAVNTPSAIARGYELGILKA